MGKYLFTLMICLSVFSQGWAQDRIGVSLDKTSITLEVGASDVLTATVEATNPVLDWSSNNPAIVSITPMPDGFQCRITAVKTGHATITIDVAGVEKIRADCEVTVISPSGNCGASGNNLTWEILDNMLVISGTGAMANYTAGNSPWYAHRLSIAKAIIGSGVTSIGNYAFQDCSNLRYIMNLNSTPQTLSQYGNQILQFYGVDASRIKLYVPSTGDYRNTTGWADFIIELMFPNPSQTYDDRNRLYFRFHILANCLYDGDTRKTISESRITACKNGIAGFETFLEKHSPNVNVVTDTIVYRGETYGRHKESRFSGFDDFGTWSIGADAYTPRCMDVFAAAPYYEYTSYGAYYITDPYIHAPVNSGNTGLSPQTLMHEYAHHVQQFTGYNPDDGQSWEALYLRYDTMVYVWENLYASNGEKWDGDNVWFYNDTHAQTKPENVIFPERATISTGQALSAATFAGGLGYGTFDFSNRDYAPQAPENGKQFKVSFTPFDAGKHIITKDIPVWFDNIVIPIETIGINEPSITLTVGDTALLTASVYPSNATVEDIIWSTDCGSMLEIIPDGLRCKVVGKAKGTCNISVATGTVNGGMCKVLISEAVVPVAVENVNITAESIDLSVGIDATLSAIITPTNAANQRVSWGSTNSSVASVTPGGASATVTGLSEGRAVIWVRTDDGNKTDSCTVNVSKRSQSIADFTGNIVKTYGDGSFTLSAYATSGLPVGYTVTNPAGLTVAGLSGDNNNTVTILGAGEATITAYQNGNGTYAAAGSVSRTITVGKAPLNIRAENKQRYFGTSNPEFTLLYTGFKNNDNTTGLDTPPTVACSADINSSPGIYTIEVSGGADKNYEYERVNGTLEILPPAAVPVTNVAISAESIDLSVDMNTALSAVITPENATNRGVSWGSDNSSIASVTSYSGTSAIITGISEGTAIIWVRTDDGNRTDSCTVTVTDPNMKAVQTAKGLIETQDASYWTVAQTAANTADIVKALLAERINAISGMSATGVTVTATNINVSAFQAASAGTLTNPDGRAGSFTFTVQLTKESASRTTASRTGTITATQILSGPCGAQGDNLIWTLLDGKLTVSGSGAMANYGDTPKASTTALWFQYCDSISTIVIGEGVTSIGNYAFAYLPAVTSVTIPGSVTSIGYSAFFHSARLSDVTSLRKEPPALGSYVFTGISPKAMLHVLPGSENIYHSTPGWSAFLSINGHTFTDIPSVAGPVEAQVYSDGKNLYIDSPVAERVTVYSLTGTLLFAFDKQAGIASTSSATGSTSSATGSTRSVAGLTGILIVKGGSGWVRKVSN
jgi:uncharacterized protein YjdB